MVAKAFNASEEEGSSSYIEYTENHVPPLTTHKWLKITNPRMSEGLSRFPILKTGNFERESGKK